MKSVSTLVLLAFLGLMACDGGDPPSMEDPSGDIGGSAGPGTVQLPGQVTDPSGVPVSPGAGTVVLLYFWMPVSDHQETMDDLAFLASVAGPDLITLPVQPDAGSRNFAQTLVNQLDISLPVYLADGEVLEAIGADILPSTLLLRPDGSISRTSGFGGPARLLGTTTTGD